jgi:hypothetical protein
MDRGAAVLAQAEAMVAGSIPDNEGERERHRAITTHRPASPQRAAASVNFKAAGSPQNLG